MISLIFCLSLVAQQPPQIPTFSPPHPLVNQPRGGIPGYGSPMAPRVSTDWLGLGHLETDIGQRMAPMGFPRQVPLVPITRDFKTSDLKKGEILIVGFRDYKYKIDEGNSARFVVDALDDISNLDKFDVTDGDSDGPISDVTVPFNSNGLKIYPILQETVCLFNEYKPADGKISDIDLVSIKPIEGTWKGKDLWTGVDVIMLPSKKAPKWTFGKTPLAEMMRIGDRLSQIGRFDLSRSYYRFILQRYPLSVEAKIIRRRGIR